MPSTVILCGLFLLFLRIVTIGQIIGDRYCGDLLLFRDHRLFGSLRSRIGAYLRILQRQFLGCGVHDRDGFFCLCGFFCLNHLIIIDGQQTLRIGDVF